MAEYLGNINFLPDTRIPYNDRKPLLLPSRATDNCFFGFKELPSEKELLEPDFLTETPNPVVENLIDKFSNLMAKVKKGIDATPQKAGEFEDKLVNYKLTTLIQPDTKYPVNVEHLSPKMKIAVLKLYKYAKKEGINFQIGQASRPQPQQEVMRNDNEIGKYAAKCSPHVQNIAIDIHIMDKDLHEAQADLQKLGKYWKRLTGGRWGGDWYGKHHEPWHFDLRRKGQNLCLSQANKTKKSQGA